MKWLSLVSLTLMLLPVRAPAQTRPDFSGTWRLDEPRSVSPTFQEYVGPVVWTISQSTEEMSVEVSRGPKSFLLTYKIFATAPSAANAPASSAYRGYWEGERLVTETDQNIQNQTVTTREVRTLLAGGKEMLVERVVQVQHGYTLRGAQSYSTAKDVFVKASP